MTIPGSLKLKLHWENYFNTDKSGARERINYGKICMRFSVKL